MKTMKKKSAIWEKEIEQEELIFRRHSLKTTSEEEWRLFLVDYISVYEELWRVKRTIPGLYTEKKDFGQVLWIDEKERRRKTSHCLWGGQVQS
jgi:hypothetical protein